MLPGALGRPINDIRIDSWNQLDRCVDTLRRCYGASPQTKVQKQVDREHFGNEVIHALVFRGQTKDYSDGRGNSLLIPCARRTGQEPRWIDRISIGPGGTGIYRPSGDSSEKAEDDAQYACYLRALHEYAIRIFRMADYYYPRGLEQALEGGLGPDLERLMDGFVLHTKVLKEHQCVMLSGVTFPPLSFLIKDLFEYHEPSERFWWGIGMTETDDIRAMLASRYFQVFMHTHAGFAPSMVAILQHYGVPTASMDVTHDPLVALWFALHEADRSGEVTAHHRSESDGIVYALWVPMVRTWNHPAAHVVYSSKRAVGGGLDAQRMPGELPWVIDVANGLSMFERDDGIRSIRQDAALLMGLVHKRDAHPNSYASYMVARLSINRSLLDDARGADFLARYSASRLLPGRNEDRLLNCLIESGVKGIEQYA